MDAVQQLEVALDRLVEEDSFCHSDAASVEALERDLGRLACVASKAVAGFDTSGEWAADGAQSTAAWLSTRCHLPLAEARRQLRRGKSLPSMPVVAQAFLAGAIGVAQVDVLVRAAQGARRVSDEVFGRDEAVLVQAGTDLKFAAFAKTVAYWTQLADPDGAEASEMEKLARRDVFVSQSLGGMWLGKMTFAPIGGAIFSGELMRREAELFEADWAEAKARLGREPHLDELARTPGQRRADAAVEMAVRSGAMPEGARRPEPLFSVLVDHPTTTGRICELANGTIVSPGSLVPYLDAAWFERIVFAPGKRVECSVTSRFFTGATRRAIEVRDHECTHPYCEIAAEHCQIDHIVPYAKGGPTEQENGQVHCGFHNRRRNGEPDPPGG
jgi:Domain of unknown function (DUF222)